jgi:hypothetical protein
MSLPDLEPQHDQASAALPIIQQKYSNIAVTFLIPLVYGNCKSFKSTCNICINITWLQVYEYVGGYACLLLSEFSPLSVLWLHNLTNFLPQL